MKPTCHIVEQLNFNFPFLCIVSCRRMMHRRNQVAFSLWFYLLWLKSYFLPRWYLLFILHPCSNKSRSSLEESLCNMHWAEESVGGHISSMIKKRFTQRHNQILRLICQFLIFSSIWITRSFGERKTIQKVSEICIGAPAYEFAVYFPGLIGLNTIWTLTSWRQ